MADLIDLSGQRLGMLQVLHRGPQSKDNRATWVCKCDCGVEKSIRSKYLVAGTARSCGCQRYATTHGMTKTKAYQSWQCMKSRCDKPSNVRYSEYGGRGVTYCDRWKSFENFYADMGEPPTPKHTLDRKEVNGNYEPDNCRWATQKEQANNRRNNVFVEWQGQRMTVTQLAERTGFPLSNLRHRLKRGWSVEDAISYPLERPKVPIEYNGQSKTLTEWARQYGISQGVLWSRIKQKGMTLEEALNFRSKA